MVHVEIHKVAIKKLHRSETVEKIHHRICKQTRKTQRADTYASGSDLRQKLGKHPLRNLVVVGKEKQGPADCQQHQISDRGKKAVNTVHGSAEDKNEQIV